MFIPKAQTPEIGALDYSHKAFKIPQRDRTEGNRTEVVFQPESEFTDISD